jgi:hypothetical protein
MAYAEDDDRARQAQLVSKALREAGTPDFVAIQDLRGDNAIDGYSLANTMYDLAALVPNGTEWKLQTTMHATRSRVCGSTPAAIRTFVHTEDSGLEISIASIVVCGGTNDRQFASERSYDETKLRQYKTEGLVWCVDLGPDLIVGDFNADENMTNRAHLLGKQWTDDRIQIWNRAPFEFLREKGYTLAGTSGSQHGGQPICIWYKTSTLRLSGTSNIPLIGALMTRDGLAARFTIIPR